MIVSNIRHNSTLGISWNKKSTVGYGILFLTVALLTLFPFVTHSRFYIRLINEMLIYGLLAMSLEYLAWIYRYAFLCTQCLLWDKCLYCRSFSQICCTLFIRDMLLFGYHFDFTRCLTSGMDSGANWRLCFCSPDPGFRHDVFYNGLEMV